MAAKAVSQAVGEMASEMPETMKSLQSCSSCKAGEDSTQAGVIWLAAEPARK
jgi:hypothetical protein